MATDFETASPALQKAVRSLVGGFSAIPADWAQAVAEKLDDEELYAMPMWGTVFIANDMDKSNIEKLLTEAVPEDAVGLIEFAEDHGIEIAENEMKLLALAASDDDHEDEVRRIRGEVMEQWQESGNDNAALASFGWQNVGSTGIVAREIDGHLMLGINGAGYDFYEAHWMPLYLALGYSWHKSEEKPTKAKRKVKPCSNCGGPEGYPGKHAVGCPLGVKRKRKVG
jgi:hypothetical protein